jgi:hypothetical protein
MRPYVLVILTVNVGAARRPTLAEKQWSLLLTRRAKRRTAGKYIVIHEQNGISGFQNRYFEGHNVRQAQDGVHLHYEPCARKGCSPGQNHRNGEHVSLQLIMISCYSLCYYSLELLKKSEIKSKSETR